ncbi:MAG: hypothetical protein AAGA30_16565, partial [Planctomycetota bacterium]
MRIAFSGDRDQLIQKSRINVMSQIRLLWNLFLLVVLMHATQLHGQVVNARRSGFTWFPTQEIGEQKFGSGYSVYSAAWPIFEKYPGAQGAFQMGLGSFWLTTQRTGQEPAQFYTTIEGGLGWWGDTRFGTTRPKFIMGGVSYNFHSWANGPGAGRSKMLPNGQRDWSTPGGKYGVAQLSHRLLWAPDGLNLSQSLNGELLGYGYLPIPLTKVPERLADPRLVQGRQEINTGDYSWTLFLNTTNFKGPATFFLPTFWTEPVGLEPSINGLFFDGRPSDPNVGSGLEHANSPALISQDSDGTRYARIQPLQMPRNCADGTTVLDQLTVYSGDALWNPMVQWFQEGQIVEPGFSEDGKMVVPFMNGGGSM